MKKNIILTILCLILCFALGCGCDSNLKSSMADDYSDSMSYEEVPVEDLSYMEADAMAVGGSNYAESGIQSANLPDDSKVIYNANITLHTDNASEACKKALELCESVGGYVSGSWSSEANEYSGAYYNITLRVPAESLSSLMEGVKGLGTVESSALYTEDVSQDYYDTDARLNAAKAEEEKLLELLDKCKNVDEVLAVRSQLLTVRQEIESLQTIITRWDNQISYSTLDVYFYEDMPSPVEGSADPISVWKISDVWNQIKLGFSNSWRIVINALYFILIFIAYALVPAAVLGAIVFGIIRFIKNLKKKKAVKKEETKPSKK